MPTKPTAVPRPPNPFICYRSEVMRLHKAEGRTEGLLQTELSKRVGREWRELDAAARAPYEKMAEEKKEEHARAYPGYKYQPRRRGEVGGAGMEERVRTKTAPRSGSTSKTHTDANTSAREDASTCSTRSQSRSRSELSTPPPLDSNFTSPPPAAYPEPYSPFPSLSAVPVAPGVSTWYVAVPAATFRRLVNTPQPPSRTVNPAVLRAPYLLAYSSIRELEEAVALAEGRPYSFPHPSTSTPSRSKTGAGAQYVPVPVRSLSRPGRVFMGHDTTHLVAYPTMRALQEAAVVVDGPPSAFLDASYGHHSTSGVLYPSRECSVLRRPDIPAPFLDESTRWDEVVANKSVENLAREGPPMFWESPAAHDAGDHDALYELFDERT